MQMLGTFNISKWCGMRLVMTKAGVLGFVRSGRMKFLHYTTSDIRVRVYGDAAVVTGRLQRPRALNGNEVSDDSRFTKTYVRKAEKWRVVAFHASDAAWAWHKPELQP
jgi:hypothetical protein